METVLEKPEVKAFQGPLMLHLPKNRVWDDDTILAISVENPDLRFEKTAQGDLIIMPLVGTETGDRDSEINMQLRLWSKENELGKVFSSSAGFRLANGALRSPDASWVSLEKLATVTPEQYQKFAPVCPEFVIELLSPSDSLGYTQDKMLEYIANGAELGWLIDPDEKKVYLYTVGNVEMLENPESVVGVGRLEGFVLELRNIW